MKVVPLATIPLAAALLLSACVGGGTGGAAPGAAAGGTTYAQDEIRFAGLTGADAVTPGSILISWEPVLVLERVSGEYVPSDDFIYRVYVGETANSIDSLLVETPLGAILAVDADVPPDTTRFYRVAPVHGGVEYDHETTSSGHTPPPYNDGLDTPDFSDITPYWATMDASGNTCLTCHDGSYAFDLNDFSSAVNRLGLVPFDAAATEQEFLFRFVAQPLDHIGYSADPEVVRVIAVALGEWALVGAPEIDDVLPPWFGHDDLSTTNYRGEWLAGQMASIAWPEAKDEGSGGGSPTFRYDLYAGTETNTIDWTTPVLSTQSPITTGQFYWPDTTRLVVVVRPTDGSGNQGVNEREVYLGP